MLNRLGEEEARGCPAGPGSGVSQPCRLDAILQGALGESVDAEDDVMHDSAVRRSTSVQQDAGQVTTLF